MGVHYEESRPKSPFAANIVTVLVYAVAIVVVLCWFVVMLEDPRPATTAPSATASSDAAQTGRTASPDRKAPPAK